MSVPRASTLIHLGSYFVFRVGTALIRLLPLEVAFDLGQAAGHLAYYVLPRRRRIALRNLTLAFGAQKSQASLRKLNREHFRLLVANLITGLKIAGSPPRDIWERISAVVPEERFASGWIALISHTGNWELYSHLASKFPEYRFGAIYQPLANPFIDRYIHRARTKSGIAMFDRRTELLRSVKFLREGGVLAVLADQGAGHAGLWTPLFRRLTSSSTLAARLAIRTGLPMVPIAITTSGRARWKMKVSEPIYLNSDDPETVTADINRLLEEQVRQSPADWLWAHNRWKPLRPHFLLARGNRPVSFPAGFDQSTLDPFRILIVAPPFVTQSTLIAVGAIKRGRPDTWVAVLDTASANDDWAKSNNVDEVLSIRTNESVFSIASIIRKAARFDVAISFTTRVNPALAIWLAGIPVRVGLRRGANAWLCNQHPVLPDRMDDAQIPLLIARSVGAEATA